MTRAISTRTAGKKSEQAPDFGPTLLDFMEHPDLAGRFFEGTSWDAWRSFAKAAFALPMDEDDLARFQQHTNRDTPPTVPFTEIDLICGRRSGKSRFLATTAVYLSIRQDFLPYLAPGEVGTVAVLASSRDQARNIFRYVDGLISDIPALAAEVTKRTDTTIELGRRRVVIEIGTASFRTTRGYSFIAVLGDEIAFWRDESGANPDTEILAAIRPGLSTLPGAMLLKASSPYAKRGELYRSYRLNFGRDDARVLTWQADTASMNPTIDPAIIASAYEEDPQRASAEYGAQFRNDVAAFVSREAVDAVVDDGETVRAPQTRSYRYVAFADPSGGSSDSFALAIAHQDMNFGPTHMVLDLLHEIKPPFSPEAAVREIAEILKAYGIRSLGGDRYGAEWIKEAFGKCDISYEHSKLSKSDLYKELLPRLHSRTVSLLDNPVLIRQLCNLERRTARGGRDSIDHPAGEHDDIANAAAGALVGPGEFDAVDFYQRLGGGDIALPVPRF